MTIQSSETLVYEGNEYGLRAHPLSQYTPKLVFNSPGSFCWRGYYGTWEIKNNQLYLTDLVAWRNDPLSRSVVPQMRLGDDGELYMGEREEFELITMSLLDVFPNSTKEGLCADWFTGSLFIPIGDEEDDGKHLKYLNFDFSNGALKNKSSKTHDEVMPPLSIEDMLKMMKEDRREN